MKSKIANNTSAIARGLIDRYVYEGSIVLDATVGNGNDTIALAKAVGQNGMVFGFDIQKNALEITSQKLKDANLESRVKLIEDSHENIDDYIEAELDFIIYNLGYLPKGDKNIKTCSSSTTISLGKALNKIRVHGLIVITVYTGHEGGLEEKESIENVLSTLNQKEFNVLKYEFINQINSPPILYVVERIL